MKKLHAKALLALVVAGCTTHLFATGYYGPSDYLEEGGKNVTATPEFYWDLEVKRLARDFHPVEKFVVTPPPDKMRGADGDTKKTLLGEATADVDSSDFEAALKDGEIKPPDSKKATDQHEAARAFIATTDEKTTATLPPEFDSEFADYHRGAYAFWLGKAHWDEARKAWEALLKRPDAERHYRSVWAAFMLGKMAMKSGDPDAVKWFQQTRELAKQGFADSLGMAADSYGWEGRSEWKQGHPEKAAPLFLTQLALGDESAVVSLKALIPDRDAVDGMVNYGPDQQPDPEKMTDEQKKAAEQKILADYKTAAADPLLRRLVTVYILAVESGADLYGERTTSPALRCAQWLSVVKATNSGPVEDAEYLGWVAYTKGDYMEAAHWLELAKGDTPAACWLRAKLQLRAGKVTDAAKSMAKAWESIRELPSYTGLPSEVFDKWGDRGDEFIYRPDGGSWFFPQSAGGDLAALHLEGGDFVQALDTFRKGGLWDDAAFVAERVLTADELKKYVDAQPAVPPPDPAKTGGNDPANAQREGLAALKYLLGRRLVREDRYAEAAAYLPPPYDKILGRYAQALKDGADEKLPKEQRARAWFTAAWLARYDGMEMMGTEVSPDGFESEGEFENIDVAGQRLTGRYVPANNGGGDQDKKPVSVPIPFKASKLELQRLAQNKTKPDIRYHYRLVAGALAVKAAGFLADNTDELADVVNTAGGWVKDRDEKAGDRYYQIIEKRCAKTKIGQAAIAKHWFVDDSGPWSAEQQSAYDAMHKELDPKPAS